MKYVPRIVYTEISDNLGDEFKTKIYKYLFSDEHITQILFEDYLKTLIDPVFFNEDIVDFNELRNSFHRRRQQTKKRWVQGIISDLEKGKPNPISEEANWLSKMLERKQDKESIEALFKTTDPEIFIQQKIEELQSWAENHDTMISEFPYLDSKRLNQLEKAFNLEILFITSDYLAELAKNPNRRWITEHPNEMVGASAAFQLSTKTIKANASFTENQQMELYDSYKLSDGSWIVSILQPDENDDVQLDKFSALDNKDWDIIGIIFGSIGERFYKEKIVVVDIRNIVKEIYNSEGSRAYSMTEERLKKIGRFRIEGRVLNQNKERKESFLINFFQTVRMIKDEVSGRSYVEITVHDKIHQQFIDRQTVQIYSHLLKKIETPVSRILIYAFQKERMDAYLEQRPMRKTFDYNYFHDRIRFRSKKVEANLKLIQESLKEFCEMNVIVSSFKRVGSGFEIQLHPITEDEKQDYFNSARPLHLLEG